MKNYLKIIFCLLLFNFSACSGRSNEQESQQLINIEGNIGMFKKVYLSQFTNDIRYFPLETKENQLIGNVSVSDISDSLILINGNCILYNIKGKFIRKISNKGFGPSEYRYYSNARFGYNKNLFFQDLYDLMEFNLDGSFIKRYKNTFVSNDNYIEYWKPINDSLFFGNIGNSTGRKKLKAIIFNKHGDIKYSYNNYEYFYLEKIIYGGYLALANFYEYDKKIFYKAFYNDTLFYLSGNYCLFPQYVFNSGKLKEPISVRGVRTFSKYVYIDRIFQTTDYLFIKCDFGDLYPAKRLTPLIIMKGIQPTWYNSRFVLGIYEIKTGELVFSTPTSTDNPLFTSGLYNDIDAGPRFFPEAMVNDSTMVMCISSKRFKDHIASNDFIGSKPLDPDKKKKLEDLANSLTDYDNPVLMFVTFNKRPERIR